MQITDSFFEDNQDYLRLVLDAIGSVPHCLLPEMYRDFRNAGESQDVKNILEVIAK